VDHRHPVFGAGHINELGALEVTGQLGTAGIGSNVSAFHQKPLGHTTLY
jgi:hypothetical protein